MSIDKTLNKLHNIIHETLPNLELFVDNTIQPSSSDCDNLQKQLYSLQEQLSIFKYLKTNKEISPSFDIHSKVSNVNAAKTDVVSEVIIKEEEIINKPFQTDHVSKSETASSSSDNRKKIEVSLNQKFQIINELFNQNAKEYGLAIDQINDCSTWPDTESYLLSLKSAYSWKDSNENYKRLVEISKKRFE